MADYPKEKPIAVLDDNYLTRKDMKMYNNRRTIVFESTEDPIRIMKNICLKSTTRDSCFIEDLPNSTNIGSQGNKLAAAQPDFAISSYDVYTSICAITLLVPHSLQNILLRPRQKNVQGGSWPIKLDNKSLSHLARITNDSIKAKLNLRRMSYRSRNCRLNFGSNGITQRVYDASGILKESYLRLE